MNYFQAILFGAVQGIGEYLPISSSAHLILLPDLLHMEDPGLAFDVFLHGGTLLATLFFFWRDWWNILLKTPVIGPVLRRRAGPAGPSPMGLSSHDDMSWEPLVIATIPAVIVGAALHHWVETVFRGNIVMVFTLSIGGVILFLVDHYCRRDREVRSVRWVDALIVGTAQCFALVPGVSRSGSTITASRALGLNREASARFSFLISAPVTFAATVFELRHWRELFESTVGAGPMIVAGLSAFVFGVLAIGALLKMLRTHSYLVFAIYRVCLAVAIWKVVGV